MQLLLFFKQEKHILIDVFKENKEWFDFFKDLNVRQKDPYRCQPTFVVRQKVLNLEANWQELKKNIKSLEEMGFKSPIEIGETNPYDQKIHNDLHRIFTYSNEWVMQNYNFQENQFKEGMTPHPLDDKFVPSDVKLFLEIIHNINTLVHATEDANMTLNKFVIRNSLAKHHDYFISRQNTWGPEDNNWFSKLTPAMEDIQFKYVDMDCDVYMSEEIQGKSYLRAFIDADDPTKKDVTGRLGSYGSFIVDTTGNRKKIYQSTRFQNWLQGYNLNVNQLPLEWPLGKVIDRDVANGEKPDLVQINFLE